VGAEWFGPRGEKRRNTGKPSGGVERAISDVLSETFPVLQVAGHRQSFKNVRVPVWVFTKNAERTWDGIRVPVRIGCERECVGWRSKWIEWFQRNITVTVTGDRVEQFYVGGVGGANQHFARRVVNISQQHDYSTIKSNNYISR